MIFLYFEVSRRLNLQRYGLYTAAQSVNLAASGIMLMPWRARNYMSREVGQLQHEGIKPQTIRQLAHCECDTHKHKPSGSAVQQTLQHKIITK